MSEKEKKFNSKCPECKANAITLFLSVKCVTSSCKNFDPNLLEEEPKDKSYYDQYGYSGNDDGNCDGYEGFQDMRGLTNLQGESWGPLGFYDF